MLTKLGNISVSKGGILFCAFLFSIFECGAINIDSLKTEVTHVHDTDLVNLYLKIGKAYITQEGEADSLIRYGQLAFQQSSTIHFSKGIIRGLMFEGNGHAVKNEFEASFKLWKRALTEAEKTNDKYSIADINNNLGYNYQQQEKYDEAISHYLVAASAYESLHDYDGMGPALSNVSSIFGSQNQIPKCFFYLEKCKSIVSKMQDPYARSITCAAMARQYAAFSETNPVYLDTTLQFVSQAYQMAVENEMFDLVPECYNIFSVVYFLKKDFAKTIEYCERLLERKIEVDETTLLENYVRLSDCYNELGEISRAFTYLDSADAVSVSTTLYNKSIVVDRRFHLNKKAGNFELAMKYLEELRALDDSIFTIEKNARINELEERYNRAANEKTINELNQEKEISSLKIQTLWIGIFAVVVILLVLFILYRQRIQKSKLEKELNEQRLNQARMNPHFVFNAITSIQHFIMNRQADEAKEYLTKFSKLMRSVMDHSMNERMSLGDELEFLAIYIELEKLRFKVPFQFILEIDPAIDQDFTQIPSMLIQPFVENAIKHGLWRKQSPGRLLISISQEQDRLKFVIEDDGIGRDKSAQFKNEQHQSAGMQITASRLQLMNVKAKSDLNLKVEDLKDSTGGALGTRVVFYIPSVS